MAKKMVLLSDGTGNSASKVWRTNVWRMFEAINLSGTSQVAFYDDGVGSSSFKPAALLGGAFGWGLKRNVLDLYKFVCRNYKDSTDEIFAFGFSRGAFTIRVVIGLILNQGLVQFTSEAELEQKARAAYRAYRRERYHSVFRVENIFRWVRDLFVRTDYDKSKNWHIERIRFLGLWDTVAAYGLPVDEMTLGVSRWIWPLQLPDRTLHPKIARACHALSLDDERTTFHPVLWDETNEKPNVERDGKRYTKDERISQVWFAGVHANVGGGYPDDSLAHVPLCWIMKEAQACDLQFKAMPKADPDALIHALSVRDKDGRQYDPRSGLGGYYRYGPRKIFDLCHLRIPGRPQDTVNIAKPKIHESALTRLKEDVHHYAPIGLPAEYEIVTDLGEILPAQKNPSETPPEAANRAARQEAVWDLVWVRRIVYFLTVGTSIYLATYPLARKIDESLVYSTHLRPISDLIGIFSNFIPSSFSVWTDAYQARPDRFIAVIALLVLLMSLGSRLNTIIGDRMRTIWRTPSSEGIVADSLIYRVRSSPVYRWLHDNLRYRLAPLFFALIFVFFGVTFASHLAFNFADSAGLICTPTVGAKMIETGTDPVTRAFQVKDVCTATGVVAEKGSKYRIEVKQSSAWTLHDIPVTLRGKYVNELSGLDRLQMMFLWPLKRAFIRPWGKVIVRFGATGTDEDFLDPNWYETDNFHSEVIIARKTGEVFVYVNDAVLAVPGHIDLFNRKNEGQAEITVRNLGR